MGMEWRGGGAEVNTLGIRLGKAHLQYLERLKYIYSKAIQLCKLLSFVVHFEMNKLYIVLKN